MTCSNLKNISCLIFESLEEVPGPMLERRDVTEPRFRPEAEEELVRCFLAAAVAPSAAASGAAEDALEAAPGEPLLALPPAVAFFLICLKTFFMASQKMTSVRRGKWSL